QSGCNWIMLFLQLFNLLDKLLRLFEPAVHTRVTHIRHLVHVLKRGHHSFANGHRRHFAIVLIPDLLNDLFDDFLKFTRTHRTFAGGYSKALQQFLRGEWLAAVIPFHHSDRLILNHFICREAMPTSQTFAPPPDGASFARSPRIDHLIFLAPTLAA